MRSSSFLKIIPAPIFIGINSSRSPVFHSWIPIFMGITTLRVGILERFLTTLAKEP